MRATLLAGSLLTILLALSASVGAGAVPAVPLVPPHLQPGSNQPGDQQFSLVVDGDANFLLDVPGDRPVTLHLNLARALTDGFSLTVAGCAHREYGTLLVTHDTGGHQIALPCDGMMAGTYAVNLHLDAGLAEGSLSAEGASLRLA